MYANRYLQYCLSSTLYALSRISYYNKTDKYTQELVGYAIGYWAQYLLACYAVFVNTHILDDMFPALEEQVPDRWRIVQTNTKDDWFWERAAFDQQAAFYGDLPKANIQLAHLCNYIGLSFRMGENPQHFILLKNSTGSFTPVLLP